LQPECIWPVAITLGNPKIHKGCSADQKELEIRASRSYIQTHLNLRIGTVGGACRLSFSSKGVHLLCLRDVFCAAVRPLAVLGLTFALAAIPIAAQNVPQPINLSSAVGGGSNPLMAFDANGGIDVAWVGAGVFFTRSTDGGATFSTTTVIPLSFPPLGVQMGIDTAGNIELLWPTSPDDLHPGGRAFLSRSTDHGMTFSAAGEFAPPAGVTSSAIQMAVESTGAINVIWQDQVRANLFFARSTDGGLNFSEPLSIWSETQDLADLHVARGASNQIYVFWTHISDIAQCDVLFSRTLDAGATFSAAANVSATTGACSASPKPFVDPTGGVNVAWLKDNQSVWFQRSSDQGANFSTAVNVSGGVAFFQTSDQQISGDPGGELDVVWTGVLAENAVFFALSSDGGTTFSAPKIVSLPPQPNNTGAGNPAIGEDSCGNISVAWADDSAGTFSGDFDVYLDRSSDGRRFSNPLNVSNTAADAEVVSQIAVDAHDVSNLLWTTVTFPSDVYFSRIPPSLARPGDFEVVVHPETRTAAQGETDKFTVAVASTLETLGKSVNLSCSELPPFATCTFNPATVTSGIFPQLSTLTLTIPATLNPGKYLFGVNGVSASTTSTETVQLTVTAPGSAAMAAVAEQAARASPAAAAASSSLRLQEPLDGAASAACLSGNERLCGALRGEWPHPRWRRARRCGGEHGFGEVLPRRE
jgi:hypothetical protein